MASRGESLDDDEVDEEPVPQAMVGGRKAACVMAAVGAGESGRGELLRREGLHEADLERFQRELAEEPKSATPKRDASDKKRIAELEREVRRKDKALAEATALVVLSKKLNAYFDPDGVGDEDKESGK